MNDTRKLCIAAVATAAAALLAHDALAGNLRSNATPTTQFWYRTVEAGRYLQWTGPSEWGILIDDIVYTGFPEPGDENCQADLVCSVFDFNVGPDTTDFGELVEINIQNMTTSVTGTTQDDSGNFSESYRERFNATTGSTEVYQSTRMWTHEVEILESPPVGIGQHVDRWTLTGTAMAGVRETQLTTMFWDIGNEFVQQINENSSVLGTFQQGGAGGAGAGVGTGLGLAGWLTDTSAHRAFQTPFLVNGNTVQVVDTNFPSAKVTFHGRLITDPLEIPVRTNNFIVQEL